MLELAPSILAADFARLGEQVEELEEAGIHYLHLDVMDGVFVPSISFGMPVIKSLRQKSGLFFDVHLMVEEPDRFLEEFRCCGADGITVHGEAVRHLHRTVSYIRQLGAKAGVALNPATPPEELEYILPDLDMVLIMSVDPGFGGQTFLPSMLEKIRQVREMANKCGHKLLIEVDGGIDREIIRDVMEAGADIFVAGTAVFEGNITENIKVFKEIFADGNKRP